MVYCRGAYVVLTRCGVSFAQRATKELEDCREQMGRLRELIAHAYDELPREENYALHAILVHSGSPGDVFGGFSCLVSPFDITKKDLGGHYWAYIVDHASGEWFKFNDVTVSRVANVDEMMREST